MSGGISLKNFDVKTVNRIITLMKHAKELGVSEMKIGELELKFDTNLDITENITKSIALDSFVENQDEPDIRVLGVSQETIGQPTNKLEQELRMIVDPVSWEEELLNENQEAQDFGATPTL